MTVSFQPQRSALQCSLQIHERASAQISTHTGFSATPESSPGVGDNGISTAVADLKVSKIGYSANAKTIMVQDRMMGELLDIIS